MILMVMMLLILLIGTVCANTFNMIDVYNGAMPGISIISFIIIIIASFIFLSFIGVLLSAIFLGILFISAAFKSSGFLSKILMVLGIISIFKGFFFLKAKFAERIITWIAGQPPVFFRFAASVYILIGLIILLG